MDKNLVSPCVYIVYLMQHMIRSTLQGGIIKRIDVYLNGGSGGGTGDCFINSLCHATTPTLLAGKYFTRGRDQLVEKNWKKMLETKGKPAQ